MVGQREQDSGYCHLDIHNLLKETGTRWCTQPHPYDHYTQEKPVLIGALRIKSTLVSYEALHDQVTLATGHAHHALAIINHLPWTDHRVLPGDMHTLYLLSRMYSSRPKSIHFRVIPVGPGPFCTRPVTRPIKSLLSSADHHTGCSLSLKCSCVFEHFTLVSGDMVLGSCGT